jgi:hypothetical protein
MVHEREARAFEFQIIQELDGKKQTTLNLKGL